MLGLPGLMEFGADKGLLLAQLCQECCWSKDLGLAFQVSKLAEEV